MFHEFGTSEPSSHCSLYKPGWVTSTTSKGLSQTGESLCRSLVVCIFRKMKSPTLKLHELMLHVWYHLIACWCFADWMTIASRNSSNLVKSSIRESSDWSSLNYYSQKYLCSTSVGNIALDPYTNENGVWHVAWLGVMGKAHRTDDNSFTHFSACGFNL
jgi:hypothetical protein